MKPFYLGIIFLLSILVKLFLAWQLPVFGDEAYYWFWGQHLQLSYFDHPGMVGWLTSIGSQLDFLPYSLTVRWPFVLLSTGSLYLFIIMVQNSITTNKDFRFGLIILYLLNPLLGFGGILATPDVPLIFFWSLSFFVMNRIVLHQKKLDYALLGAALGLGLCSKYHIVLFPITMLLSLFFSKKLSAIQPKKLMLTIFFGLIFSMPVLIWNYQNDWASFAFQLNHGFNGRSYTPTWAITYALGQIFLFNPFLFYQLFQGLKKSFYKNAATLQWIFFLMSSFRAGVEANWPVTAHFQGLVGFPFMNKKIFRLALNYWFLIWAIFIGFYFSTPGQKKISTLPNSQSAEKIWAIVKPYSPLYGPTYQISSLLQLVSGQKILKLYNLSRSDFYDSALFQQPQEKVFYALKYDISSWPLWLAHAKIQPIQNFPEFTLGLYRIDNE